MKDSRISFIAYDTVCSIRIFEDDQRKAELVLKQAREQALRIQSSLSMYDPNSELSRICANYRPGRPIEVTHDLCNFVQFNLEISRISGGAFDFTVGPLMKLWNFSALSPKVPSRKAIEAAKQRIGFRHVHIDMDSSTLTFDVPGMILDPGASGKGYALEKTANYLHAAGIENAILNFGGNIYSLGGRVLQEGNVLPWNVSIRHPNGASYLGCVALCNRGIATSSWYEHSFREKGRLYHHLMNPLTGTPYESDISSISVLSSRAVFTDALSTACFLRDARAAAGLVEMIQREKSIDIDYVILKKDGEILSSKNAHFVAANS